MDALQAKGFGHKAGKVCLAREKNRAMPLESSISRLEMYISKLEIHIFRLEIYIFRLDI